MKSHWWIIWKMLDGSCVRVSTRAGGLDPMTLEEMKEHLSQVLQEASRVWVEDADRAAPVLIFTSALATAELEPESSPVPAPEKLEAEAERHLELVRGLEAVPNPPEDYDPMPPLHPRGGYPKAQVAGGPLPWCDPRDYPDA